MLPRSVRLASSAFLGRSAAILALLIGLTTVWAGCDRFSTRRAAFVGRGVVQVTGRGETALPPPFPDAALAVERPVDLSAGGDEAESPDVAEPAAPSPFRRSGEGFPSWGSRAVDLPVVVPLAPEAGSRVEAIMIARRNALDEALRRVANYVTQLPTPDGDDTVGDRLRADAKLAERVETLIRSNLETAAEGEIVGGSYALKARLNLEPIALEMWGEDVAASDDTLPQVASPSADRRKEPRIARPALEETKRKARALALADARRIMLDQLKQERLFPNYTVEDLMLADDKAARQVRTMAESAEIVEERYPALNVCEIVLSLDFDAALSLLRR